MNFLNGIKIEFIIILWSFCFKQGLSYGTNGGMNCGSCVLGFTVIYHLKHHYNLTSSEALPKFCSVLPSFFREPCEAINIFLGDFVATFLEKGYSPDIMCHELEFCYVGHNSTMCHLHPLSALDKTYQPVTIQPNDNDDELSICQLPLIKDFCASFENKLYRRHHPANDKDGDGFSSFETQRGYDWRGFDCDDTNKDIYPGRIPIDDDRTFDSNCNGIWGVNPKTGIPYETELCSDSDQKGVIVLGDSVSAHFHIPEQWAEIASYTPKIFENLTFAMENNLDWPQISHLTGFKNLTWEMLQNESSHSLYWRMRNNNLCNNNDYHNFAFNGATVQSIMSDVDIRSIRNKHLDKPALVIFATYGNDVCNCEVDTVNNMTTVEQLRTEVLKFLEIMNQILPPKSHVLLVGLLQGQYLYDALFDKIHPIGKLKNDITYKDFYNWIECLLVTPCLGWMSSKVHTRNETTKRADELSSAYQQIAKEFKNRYSNFDVQYYRVPVNEVHKNYGPKFYTLLEPIDGFHPNRIGQSILSNYFWNFLENNSPQSIGQANKNNDLIGKLFTL